MKTINIEVRTLIMETINEHKMSWKDERCDDFIYSFLTEMKKREGQSSYFSGQLYTVNNNEKSCNNNLQKSNWLWFAWMFLSRDQPPQVTPSTLHYWP